MLLVGVVQDDRRVLAVAKHVVSYHGSLRMSAEDHSAAVGCRDRRKAGISVREGVPFDILGLLAELRDLRVGPEIPDADGTVLRAACQGLAIGLGEDGNAADVPFVALQRLDAAP